MNDDLWEKALADVEMPENDEAKLRRDLLPSHPYVGMKALVLSRGGRMCLVQYTRYGWFLVTRDDVDD